MHIGKLLVLASFLAAGTTSLFADGVIPYPDKGTPVANSYVFTANTSEIDAYFVSYNAGDTDTLYLYDTNTGQTYGPGFTNKMSTQGDENKFTGLTVGDTFAFEIKNTSDDPASTYSTLASLSGDSAPHAYVTDFAGGTLPDGGGTMGSYSFLPGTYVGFEDLNIPTPTDYDYNDLAFVFTNVTPQTIAPTPEPSTFILLGTGLIGAAGALRRKFAL
jgi:hypothetical protein